MKSEINLNTPKKKRKKIHKNKANKSEFIHLLRQSPSHRIKVRLKVRTPHEGEPRNDIISGDVSQKGIIRPFRGKNSDDRDVFFRCGLTRMVTRGLFHWKTTFFGVFVLSFGVIIDLFFTWRREKRWMVCNVDILVEFASSLTACYTRSHGQI